MPNWFVVRDGAEQGPLSSGQLRKLVVAGQVRQDDLVRREDIPKRVRAGSVNGLFDTEAVKAGAVESARAQVGSEPADIPPGQHPPPDSSPSPTRENATPSDTAVPLSAKATGQRVLNASARLAGDFGKDILAAARFAKAKVQSASTERLSLRKAYVALGAHLVAEATTGKTMEFSEICDQIRSLDAEINATRAPTDDSAKSNTLADRAKTTARAAKNAAIRQRLESKRHELLAQLGRASFERFAQSAGPAEIVAQISEATARITALEAEAHSLETVARGRLLTPRRLAVGGGILTALIVVWFAASFFNSGSAGLGPSGGSGVGQQPDAEELDLSSQFFDQLPTSARSGQFVGKRITLSGNRSSAVRQDDGGYAYHLDTLRRGVSVKCLFSGSEARKAQASSERQFTISGKFSRILEVEMGTLEFVDCRIVAEGNATASRGPADLPTLDQFVTQVKESGESTSPKGLPIRVRDKYLLRQRLGEPTNVLNSYRDRKGTHEILDYACRDGRVILTVTYDLAGAWIYDVAIRRER